MHTAQELACQVSLSMCISADWDCHCRALEEAEGLILSRRKTLREAEQRAKDAEAR